MANQGVSPVDYTSPIGQFRAFISDTDAEEVSAGVGEYAFYGDEAAEGLILAVGGSVKRAAVQALRTIAASQALVLKKFSTDDLTVDGPAIARALRDLANDLEAQADAEDSGIDMFEYSRPGGTCDVHVEAMPFAFPERVGFCVCGDMNCEHNYS